MIKGWRIRPQHNASLGVDSLDKAREGSASINEFLMGLAMNKHSVLYGVLATREWASNTVSLLRLLE